MKRLKRILQRIKERDKSLTEIRLARKDQNKRPLGDKEAIALAKALEGNTTVKSISLNNNHIGDAGAVALANILAKNDILESISLKGNHIRDKGATALAEALKANKTLKVYNLRDNRYGQPGAYALASVLGVPSALEHYFFDESAITDSTYTKDKEAFYQRNSVHGSFFRLCRKVGLNPVVLPEWLVETTGWGQNISLNKLFEKISALGYFSQAGGQCLLDALVKSLHDKNTLSFLHYLVSLAPKLLTATNLNRLKATDAKRLEDIKQALFLLNSQAPHLLTQEGVWHLIIDDNYPSLMAIFLTTEPLCGISLENILYELKWTGLISENCIDGLDKKDRDYIFDLIKAYRKRNIFNITTLARFASLGKEQLALLKDVVQLSELCLLPSTNMDLMLPSTLALAMKYHQANQYACLDKQIKQAVPTNAYAGNDALVCQSNERLQKLKTQLAQPIDLDTHEHTIRERLLKDIAREFDESNKKAAQFIRDNLPTLATRQDSGLIKQALLYIQSNESVAQIAWRAYEPTAKTVEWPNLLTKPFQPSTNIAVFSTPASRPDGIDTMTLDMAVQATRENAVLCFMAACQANLRAEQKQALWNDFKQYIAEIRRAHNPTCQGQDNPSCLPGTITRIAMILNKHPWFNIDNQKKSILHLVYARVKVEIDLLFGEYLNKNIPPAEKKLLYFALIGFDLNACDELIAKPNKLATILSASEYDASDTDMIKKAMTLRAAFLYQLNQRDILTNIATHLKRYNIAYKLLVYLVSSALAQIRTLGISLTQQGLKLLAVETPTASTETDEPPFDVWPLETLKRFAGNRTPEQQERAVLRRHHLPSYRLKLYDMLKKACPKIDNTELIELVRNQLSDDLATLDDLKNTFANLNGRNLAQQFKVADDSAISEALTQLQRAQGTSRYSPCA